MSGGRRRARKRASSDPSALALVGWRIDLYSCPTYHFRQWAHPCPNLSAKPSPTTASSKNWAVVGWAWGTKLKTPGCIRGINYSGRRQAGDSAVSRRSRRPFGWQIASVIRYARIKRKTFPARPRCFRDSGAVKRGALHSFSSSGRGKRGRPRTDPTQLGTDIVLNSGLSNFLHYAV